MHSGAILAFVAVCDTGSFRAAGQRLHLSQPAISKRIAGIEARLGRALFDRVGRRAELTEAGRCFLPHARRLLADFEDAQRALDDLSGQVSGQLNLALSHHVALHRMPPVLRHYHQAFPQVALKLRFLGSEDACRAVAHGSVELAVITLPDAPPENLEQQTVWRDPLQVLVATDHPLAREPAPKPAALADVPALLPEADTVTHAIVARELARHGVSPRVALTSNYLETLRMLAAAGLGWTVLPATMADDSNLVALEFTDLPLVRNLGWARHPERSLSNAAAAMLQLLRRHQLE